MVTKALDILNKAYSSQSDMFELADRTQVRVKQVKKNTPVPNIIYPLFRILYEQTICF